LNDQGYVHPTPIQAEAIPIVLKGIDLMGAAQTGTGKTAGFSLPIIQLLLAHASSSTSPARHPVRALILTPTRELADQVAANVKAYCRHTSLRSTVVFGGMDMKPQTVILKGGVEIVIATPGRLLDHVEQKNINLGQVQMLVMDEADRMLDMGFFARFATHHQSATEEASESDVLRDVLARDQETRSNFPEKIRSRSKSHAATRPPRM
jgi:ATP-dependent RNA helicase RhlE